MELSNRRVTAFLKRVFMDTTDIIIENIRIQSVLGKVDMPQCTRKTHP